MELGQRGGGRLHGMVGIRGARGTHWRIVGGYVGVSQCILECKSHALARTECRMRATKGTFAYVGRRNKVRRHPNTGVIPLNAGSALQGLHRTYGQSSSIGLQIPG